MNKKQKEAEIEAMSFLVVNAIINDLNAEETAEYLFKHGYRKQSDTVKEFAEKLIMYFSSQEIIVAAREHYAENDTLHSYFQGSRCTYGDAKQKVNEVAASFGGEDK